MFYQNPPAAFGTSSRNGLFIQRIFTIWISIACIKKTYHSDSRVALDGPFDNLGMPAPLPQPGHLGPTCNDSLETHYNQQRNRSAPFLTIMATHIAGRTHPVRIAAQKSLFSCNGCTWFTPEGKSVQPQKAVLTLALSGLPFLRERKFHGGAPALTGQGSLMFQTISSGSFPWNEFTIRHGITLMALNLRAPRIKSSPYVE